MTERHLVDTSDDESWEYRRKTKPVHYQAQMSREYRGWYIGTCSCGWASKATAYPGYAENDVLEHAKSKNKENR